MGRASRKKKQKLERVSTPAVNYEPRPLGPSLTRMLASERRHAEIPKPPTAAESAAPIAMAPAERFRKAEKVSMPPFSGKKLGSIFRFFREYDHAVALSKGDVWISTLEECRAYENASQGDAGEGTMKYAFSGELVIDGFPTPEQKRIAALSGIHIGGPGKFVISNSTGSHRLPDGLLLCMTENYSPEIFAKDFGEHCVEITDPISFFKHVTIALWERYHITFNDIDRVRYVGRTYRDFDLPDTHPGFLKPAQGYEHQEEVRMLWLSRHGGAVTPGLISVPEVAQYCRLIEPMSSQEMKLATES